MKFYSSNFDDHFVPDEKGWWIQYSTESGDRDAIRVERCPLDADDALEMLEEINPDELWNVEFWGEIK
jgi:hypothetical protein